MTEIEISVYDDQLVDLYINKEIGLTDSEITEIRTVFIICKRKAITASKTLQIFRDLCYSIADSTYICKP